MLSIKVPRLGESITEATVSRWLKNEGDAVAAGETIVELETDKITVEVPALKAGVLARRDKHEGDVVGVNDTLGELDDAASGATASTAQAPASGAASRPFVPAAASPPASVSAAAPAAPPAAAAPAAPPTAVPAATPPAPPLRPSPPSPPQPTVSAPVPAAAPRAEAPGSVRSAPAARRLADEAGIDIAAVLGTGRGGVVSKPDVMAAVAAGAAPRSPSPPAAAPPAGAPPQPATATTPPGGASAPPPMLAPGSTPRSTPAQPQARETVEKMSTRRKRIAENLLLAQHATAHLTTFNEIDMSAIVAVRDRLKEKVEKQFGVKLSFMPFFAKASVMALKQFPVVNAQIAGDTIVYKNYVNLGIAVASDAGLVVPNVKDADALGIIGMSREIAAVAKRARDGKLTIEDLSGGTFTITNGGVFGSLLSTPIINYPQSAILGLHKMQDRPIAVDGRAEVRPMMYIALSYDHRLIDGQQAVLFLVRIKELMEDPASMLIE